MQTLEESRLVSMLEDYEVLVSDLIRIIVHLTSLNEEVEQSHAS